MRCFRRAISYFDRNLNRLEMVKFHQESSVLIPTAVCFGDDEVLYGDAAIQKSQESPERVFRHLKRLVGIPHSAAIAQGYVPLAEELRRKFSTSPSVRLWCRLLKDLPFEVIEKDDRIHLQGTSRNARLVRVVCAG